MTFAPSKAELRRSLLTLRKSMSLEDWQTKSQQICDHLEQSAIFQQAHTVLAYFSIRQEPDLRPLFNSAHRWGFPRCVGRSLVWQSWAPTDSLPLQTGTYGILVPHPDAPVLSPDQVDLMLVPAVACDVQGYRLGYGAGFYDRLLDSPEWANKPTIGIVFEFAHLPQLPIDPWDRPLTGICTEAGLFLNRNNS